MTHSRFTIEQAISEPTEEKMGFVECKLSASIFGTSILLVNRHMLKPSKNPLTTVEKTVAFNIASKRLVSYHNGLLNMTKEEFDNWIRRTKHKDNLYQKDI